MKRVALIVMLSVACLIAGCDQDASARQWVGQVLETDAAVERALRAGDRSAAVVALTSLVSAEPPASVGEDEARAVRQDAYFRLAEIALVDEAPDRALALVEVALGLGDQRDVFSANLYIVRGKAHEARDELVEAAGDYHEALLITDAQLDRALREPSQ